MAHLLPLRFSAVLLFGAALLLSACCANNICDCNDEQEDAITLRFATGTRPGKRSFATSDLDTILIQRSPLPYKATTKPETILLINTAAQLSDSVVAVVLNNNTPFAQVGAARLSRYRYVVQYLTQLPKSKPVPTTVLVIDSIHLKGSLAGDGCCTCYTNSQKTVYAKQPKRLNPAQDSAFVVDLKQKRYLELTK